MLRPMVSGCFPVETSPAEACQSGIDDLVPDQASAVDNCLAGSKCVPGIFEGEVPRVVTLP